MKRRYILDQYDLNAWELGELKKFLKAEKFTFSDNCAPGMIGTETVIDTMVEDYSKRICGIVINYPYGFGNHGLQVIGGSRLEQVIENYRQESSAAPNQRNAPT